SLGTVVADYLALKRALGRKFAAEGRVLAGLDRFLVTRGSGEALFTPEAFAAWCLSFAHLCPTARRNHMRIVRNLCVYRRRTAPDCFVPDPATFPATQAPRPPHIFSEHD